MNQYQKIFGIRLNVHLGQKNEKEEEYLIIVFIYSFYSSFYIILLHKYMGYDLIYTYMFILKTDRFYSFEYWSISFI